MLSYQIFIKTSHTGVVCSSLLQRTNRTNLLEAARGKRKPVTQTPGSTLGVSSTVSSCTGKAEASYSRFLGNRGWLENRQVPGPKEFLLQVLRSSKNSNSPHRTTPDLSLVTKQMCHSHPQFYFCRCRSMSCLGAVASNGASEGLLRLATCANPPGSSQPETQSHRKAGFPGQADG